MEKAPRSSVMSLCLCLAPVSAMATTPETGSPSSSWSSHPTPPRRGSWTIVPDRGAPFGPCTGLPPTRIVEVAGLLNSRLIVIGGRGMTGPAHKQLGSVAHRVVELSAIPVVVIKSETHGVLKKKDRKRLEKRKKKDRKKLKELLGISRKPESMDGVDG